jgi:uncharacterized protein YkvS
VKIPVTEGQKTACFGMKKSPLFKVHNQSLMKRLKVGDTVQLTKGRQGRVKYINEDQLNKNLDALGIELDNYAQDDFSSEEDGDNKKNGAKRIKKVRRDSLINILPPEFLVNTSFFFIYFSNLCVLKRTFILKSRVKNGV